VANGYGRLGKLAVVTWMAINGRESLALRHARYVIAQCLYYFSRVDQSPNGDHEAYFALLSFVSAGYCLSDAYSFQDPS
jgi:hypothetical protein